MKGTDLKIKAMLNGIITPLETTPQLYENSVGVNELYVYSDIPYSSDIFIFAYFEKGTYNTKELLMSPEISDKENLNLWKLKIPKPVVGNVGTWTLSIECRQKVSYVVIEDGSAVTKDGYKRLTSGNISFSVFNSAVQNTIYPEDAIYTPAKDTQYENVLVIVNENALNINQNTVDIGLLEDEIERVEIDFQEQIDRLDGEVVRIDEEIEELDLKIYGKQNRLCAGDGINISRGGECDTISTVPPISRAAGLKVIPIYTDDWVDGELIITAAQHGFGETQNLFIQTQPLDEGVTYDSPQPEPNGDIILRADVIWEGNLLIGGGFAISVDYVEKLGTVGLVTTYRMHFTDNSYYDYEVENGTQGERGYPSTLDKRGNYANTSDEVIISNVDEYAAVFGTLAYPIIISSAKTIKVQTSAVPSLHQKSIILYIKRTADVAVIWQTITKWAYGEIPLLPVGEVQKILIETIDATTFYGTEGDYFNV